MSSLFLLSHSLKYTQSNKFSFFLFFQSKSILTFVSEFKNKSIMNTAIKISHYLSYLFSPIRELISMREEIQVLEKSIQNHSQNLNVMKSTNKFLRIFVLCASMLFFTKNMNAQCSGFNVALTKTYDGSNRNDVIIKATVTGGSGQVGYEWIRNGTKYSSYWGVFDTLHTSDGYHCVIAYDTTSNCRDTACITVVDSVIYNCNNMITSISKHDSCNNNDVTIHTYASSDAPYSYSYSWSTGSTSQHLFNRSSGTYTVTITNNISGCKDTLSINVVDSSGNCCQNFSGQIYETDSCKMNDVNLTAYQDGGSYSYSYLWNTGVTSQTISNKTSGSYTVTVTDNVYGCKDTLNITVVDDTCDPCSYFRNSNYIGVYDNCQANDVVIYSKTQDSSGTYTFLWNTGATTANLTGKTTGTYTVTITDNVYGCKDTVSRSVIDSSWNCCQYFNGQIYETDSCKTNDVHLTAYQYGGSNNYSYQWNTSATSQTISNKTLGSYSVTVTDNVYGCKDTLNLTVVDDTCDPCSYFRNSNYIGFYDNCQANDVVIYSKTQDSSGTYSFLWNTGGTTANLTGKTTGTYTVTITQVSTGCKDTISVSAYDSVYKCCTAYFWIQGDSSGSGGTGATKTINSYSYSQNGGITNYSWNYGDGTTGSGQNVSKTYSTAGNYTICHYIQDSTGCKDTMCKTVIAPPPGKNLKVSHYGSPYVTSIRYKWTYIVYQNLGTTSENAVVEYRMPAGMSVNYSYPSVTSTSGNKLTYNLGTLSPGAYGYIWLGLNVPSTYSTGSSKCDTANILTNTNDIDSSNNISYRCDSVVSSYDPNEKVATPKGIGAEGRIDPATKEIGYLIHFQNEGSYKTFNVRVEDEIDPSFDINSLLVGDASSTYRMVRNGRKIVWYFDGLELAPKSQNEPKSHGFVQYTLKINPGMPLGTQLKNTAYIYFDYNDAIVTNTTINTLKNADGSGGGSAIRNANSDNLDFEATRSGEKIIIVAKDKMDGIQIFDVAGKSLISKTINAKQADINFETTANAVYIIQVQIGDNTIVKKYNFK